MSITQLYGQNQISKNIYFPSDVFALDEINSQEIKEFITLLSNYSEYDIKVEGHTDQDGTNDYNLKLSQQRAESVSEFLKAEGVASQIIDVNYKGENQLIHKKDDEVSKQENRRVTLLATVYKYENTDQLIGLLDNKNENSFDIESDVDQELTLSLGTQLNIPAHAFCFEDGTAVDGKDIHIETKEAFSYLDMIDQNLFTMTNDGMLETGGMIYIKATADDRNLRLKDGQNIKISYPLQKPLENMELFTGVGPENNNINDGIIWEATGEEIESVPDQNQSFYIQVNLDPIFHHDFEVIEEPILSFTEMPAYPRKVRKAYPPSERIYSEEKYKEVYDKYLEAKALYDKDQETYDQRLKNWNLEVSNRKVAIRKYYRDLKYYHTQKRVITAIKVLENRQHSESHDVLIKQLFGFLDQKIPPVRKDEKYAIKLAFGNQTKNVKEHVGLDIFPSSTHFYDRSSHYAGAFPIVIRKIEAAIMKEKYAQGYVDTELLERYVVTSSNLGWINCDRFYEMPPDQKTELQLANTTSEEKHYLVFKNIKSVMGPNRYQGISFKNIPKNKEATVIGIKVVNNVAYLAKQDVTTGSIKKLELKYEKTSLERLKNVIQDIASE